MGFTDHSAISDFNTLLSGGLLAALIVALLITHIASGGFLDTALVLFVTVAIVTAYFARHATLPLPIWAGGVFVELAILLFMQVALGRFSTWKLALTPLATIVVIAVVLFVLPHSVSFHTFARIAASITTLLVGIGVVMFVFGLTNKPTLVSTSDANIIGLLAVVGCVGTLASFDSDRRPLDALLAVGAGLFALATASRGVWVTLVIGLVVYYLAAHVSYRHASLAVAAGAFGLFAFVVAMIILPPEWVAGVPLTNRQWLWRGTWAAITQSPRTFMSGVGFVSIEQYLLPLVSSKVAAPHGPHNGYLLVFLRAGFIAACTHIVLIWGTIAIGLYRRASPAIVACAVVVAVDMTIANFTLMTLGLRGVLLAALLGYILRECVNQWWMLNISSVKQRFGLLTTELTQ